MDASVAAFDASAIRAKAFRGGYLDRPAEGCLALLALLILVTVSRTALKGYQAK